MKNEVLSPNVVFNGVTTVNNSLPQFFINHQQGSTSSSVVGRYNPFTPSGSGGHLSESRKGSTEAKGQPVLPNSGGTVSSALLEQQKERRLQHLRHDQILAQQHRRRKSSGTFPSLLPPQTSLGATPSLLPPQMSLGTIPSVPPQTPVAPLAASATQLSPQLPALYLNVGYYENWSTINTHYEPVPAGK